ncbi:MAG: M1 family metallopeptidase [Chloroflexi bacterium]|uniref:M1 family metallopeptidase n=1 Tax=Candidatus Chlorohelix allophototropha TaxID=3003348 RepID=A0A8T7M6N9_9CHLR|nr:M1 family metallopeptidase [Chloroflexota bacterium]WJW69693.1 M1 family metallopeptidase [Chloroflexota bacterium L227-S17]
MSVVILLMGLLLTACGDSVQPSITTNPATTTLNPVISRPITTTANVNPTTLSSTTPIVSSGKLPWQPAIPNQTITRPNLSQQEKAMLPAYSGDIRLPQNQTAPIYNLALQLDINGEVASGSASEQLFFTNDTGTTLDSLYLWLWANAPNDPTYRKPLEVSNVRVNGLSAVTSPANGGAQLKVNLNSLSPGATVVIELDFTLDFPPPGKYEYFKYDAANQLLSLTFWYPQVAVYDTRYGGWDSHSYNVQGDITNSRVSFFNLWLTAPVENVVVANGKILDAKDNGDGSRTSWIVTGPVRDLVATLSPRYQSATLKAGETLVTGYYLERDNVWGERAAGFAANALLTYNDLFVVYPYAEFKMAEAPLASLGGFEFPTMILITPRYYNDSAALSLEYAVVHETAHQWWYGLVGSDQVQDAWQDESLTQYVPIFYFERFKSKAEGQRIVSLYMLNGFRNLIDSGQDDIVAQPVYAWKDFNLYLQLVYNKGGLFYQAFRKAYGDEVFLRFTRTYLERNRYRFAAPADLLDALKFAAGTRQEEAIIELYRHWMQAKEGAQDR